MIGEVGSVRGPQCRTEVLDHVFRNGREALEFAPSENASKKVKEFPSLGKDLVLKRTFSKDSHVRWKMVREQGSGQDPVS